jgi:hypothetical protein
MGAISASVRSVMTTLLTIAVSMIAVAAAASLSTPTNQNTSDPRGGSATRTAREVDPSSQGGSIERVHDEGACTLTRMGGAAGNWTHGDYVSSVARNGDHDAIRAAARSDCGKPVVSTTHGPPQHALDQAAEGRAHAGGASANGEAHANDAAATGPANASEAAADGGAEASGAPERD